MATPATDDGSADPIVRLRVEQGGVTVEKALLERGDVIGVWFRLTANSRAGREVHLVEELPDEITQADVGLHPEYEGDDWRRGPGRLHLETVADQSPTVTMYAVRNLDVTPATLATPPTVRAVTPRDRSLTS